MKPKSWNKTLMLGLMISLSQGCSLMGALNPPPKYVPSLPPRPSLQQSEVGGNELVCYDRENAYKLGRYILELRTEIQKAGE